MKQRKQQIVTDVCALLEDGFSMWERFGLKLPDEKECQEVLRCAVCACKKERFTKEYAAACQCFFLYRKLHIMAESCPGTATLLGDYFFSRFSSFLIPVDSTRLIDLFSEYLKQDAKESAWGVKEFDTDRYLQFVENAAEEIGL